MIRDAIKGCSCGRDCEAVTRECLSCGRKFVSVCRFNKQCPRCWRSLPGIRKTGNGTRRNGTKSSANY